MVDLEPLTLPNLKLLGKSLGIQVKGTKKADVIRSILAAGIPENRIIAGVQSLGISGKEPASKSSKTAPQRASATKASTNAAGDAGLADVVRRLALVEEQVRYILTKLSAVDVSIAHQAAPGAPIQGSATRDVRAVISALIAPGNTMVVDRIFQDRRLAHYPQASIERAVMELIDDEFIDGSEGASTYKVAGSIGRIMMR